MTGIIHSYPSPVEVAEGFAKFLQTSVEKTEIFNIALSGGSTPKLLFKILSKDYEKKIGWDKIHFYWGDERCVDPEDEESNFKMTNDLLFQPLKIKAENIHRVFGEVTPSEEALRYSEEILNNVPLKEELPEFDMIILGMGEDGHTASIFPHQMDLLESKHVCDVAKHPTSGQNRITITGNTLNNAKKVAFLLTGSGKKEKVDEIFNTIGNWAAYPAAHITPKNGELHWFLDEAAIPDHF
jgi:6-phosphogluconolactonase